MWHNLLLSFAYASWMMPTCTCRVVNFDGKRKRKFCIIRMRWAKNLCAYHVNEQMICKNLVRQIPVLCETVTVFESFCSCAISPKITILIGTYMKNRVFVSTCFYSQPLVFILSKRLDSIYLSPFYISRTYFETLYGKVTNTIRHITWLQLRPIFNSL